MQAAITIHSITLAQLKEALSCHAVFPGKGDWEIRMRTAEAARVIDGVRVVRCPHNDGSAIYDWSQTADELRDSDVYVSANGKLVGVMVEAWPVLVAGQADQLHTLGPNATWETLDDGKYATAAAVAHKLAPVSKCAERGGGCLA